MPAPISIDGSMRNFLLPVCVSILHWSPVRAANPVFEGWYADPEVAVFEYEYWIYPTHSDGYFKQKFRDGFSSNDLVTWTKHPKILDEKDFEWAQFAL